MAQKQQINGVWHYQAQDGSWKVDTYTGQRTGLSTPVSNRNNNNNQQKKKHSGAKMHLSYADKQTGEIINGQFITAWNYSKSRGMLSVIAAPRKDSSKRKTANEKYENWAVKVFNKRTLETTWHNGFFNKVNQKLTVKDMEWIINPRAKNGGYCGTFVK